MKERPILFSGPMVLAIMTCAKCGHISVPFPCERCGSTEFRKSQTRRVIKDQPPASCCYLTEAKPDEYPDTRRRWGWTDGATKDYAWHPWIGDEPAWQTCTHGEVGDQLWVKETFWHQPEQHDSYPGMGSLKVCDEVTIYRADAGNDEDRNFAWRPSIFLPRALSRITLEITDVRVQRVQEINLEDCLAEGIDVPGRERMLKIGPINRACDEAHSRAHFARLWDSINHERGFGWDVNPWVWAITFNRA